MARAAAWPRIRTPVGVGLVEQLELPRVLGGVDARQRERQRPAGGLGHRPEQAELGVDVVEVGHDLQHAGAGGADGAGDAEQLVGVGGEGGRELAVGAAVVAGAGGAEADGAGLHRLRGRGRPSPRCPRAWPSRAARRARPSR